VADYDLLGGENAIAFGAIEDSPQRRHIALN